MRRYAAKVDVNQREIVEALTRCGCLVLSLAAMGNGVPDLLVARKGTVMLVEIKRPGVIGKAAGLKRKRTTDAQAAFAAKWAGYVVTVDSVDAALEVMGVRHVG